MDVCDAQGRDLQFAGTRKGSSCPMHACQARGADIQGLALRRAVLFGAGQRTLNCRWLPVLAGLVDQRFTAHQERRPKRVPTALTILKHRAM